MIDQQALLGRVMQEVVARVQDAGFVLREGAGCDGLQNPNLLADSTI